MAKQLVKRVILKQKNKYYYLLSIVHKMSDGSLYITVPRAGHNTDHNIEEKNQDEVYQLSGIEENVPNTKAISYHSSGRINFKNLGSKSIFGEPLFDITRPFPFFHFSVPSISSLDVYPAGLTEEDFEIKVPDYANARNNFGIIIAPNDFNPEKIAGAGIRYEGLFDLIIAVNAVDTIPPSQYNDSFIYNTRQNGLFSSQKYPVNYSQLLHHQKLAGEQNVIIYNPNNEGVYKMYFAVPMQRIPEIKIHFAEDGLSAVILENEHRSNTTAHFKVKDKHGFIKEPKKITFVELDANDKL
jgi:hypothetical protein